MKSFPSTCLTNVAQKVIVDSLRLDSKLKKSIYTQKRLCYTFPFLFKFCRNIERNNQLISSDVSLYLVNFLILSENLCLEENVSVRATPLLLKRVFNPNSEFCFLFCSTLLKRSFLLFRFSLNKV